MFIDMNDDNMITDVDFTATTTADTTITESNEREIREDLGAEKRQLAFAVRVLEELLGMASDYETTDEPNPQVPLTIREISRVLETALYIPAIDSFKGSE